MGAQRVLVLLVLAGAGSGFLNLARFGGTATATVVIDLTVLLLLLGILTGGRMQRVEAWIILLLVCLLVSLTLLTVGNESLVGQLIAIRSRLFYAVPAVFLAICVRDTRTPSRVVDAIMASGLSLAIFGCIQYVFRAQLPEWLLVSSDTVLFGYYDTDITRSTGLVGNSIVFSTYLLLILSLWAFKAAAKPTVLRWVAAAMCELGVLSTFSRMAIVLSAVTLAAAILFALTKGGIQSAIPRLAVAAVAAMIVGLGLSGFSEGIATSFLVQDLFGGLNVSASASTAGHSEYLDLALQSLNEHPWFGIGLGSQSQESANAVQSTVITDGFHLATLVEGGLLLFIPAVLLLLSLLIRLWTAVTRTSPQRRWLPLAGLVYLAGQVFLAGFFNTGFYGKVPNLTFWLLFGAIVAMDRALVGDLPPLQAGRRSRAAWPGASGLPAALTTKDYANVQRITARSDVSE